MKRFPAAALVVANVLMLAALACSNENVVGPVEAAITNIRELISPQKDNVLAVAEDGGLYVGVSADSANVLRVGSDGLLYVPEGNGKVGPRGEKGEKGEAGPEGPQGPAGPANRSVSGLQVREESSRFDFTPDNHDYATAHVVFDGIRPDDAFTFQCFVISDVRDVWLNWPDCSVDQTYRGGGTRIGTTVMSDEMQYPEELRVVVIGDFGSS